MQSLTEINRIYEAIIHGEAKEPYRSRKMAELMDEMEREYKVPASRNDVWESQNNSVIALYKKISISCSL